MRPHRETGTVVDSVEIPLRRPGGSVGGPTWVSCITDTNNEAAGPRWTFRDMPLTGDSSILVPIDVSASGTTDRAILELLRPVDVVILGYYPVPQQTAPAHLKERHEDEAVERLERLVDEFSTTEHEVTDVLVFTKDRQDTIDRVAEQNACDAVFVPGEFDAVDRVLVPLRGDVNLNRIISLVGDLVRATDASVTLFHSVAEGDDPSQGEYILRGAADRLSEEGVDPERIDWQLSEGDDAKSAIVELATEYDLLILGETEPSLRDRIMGAVLTSIIDAVETPSIIVRDVE